MNERSCHANTILNGFAFKTLNKSSTKDPHETIAGTVKRGKQKTGTEIKILPPNKLLTKLPILLVQTNAGNNSYKLKNENRQVLSFVSIK